MQLDEFSSSSKKIIEKQEISVENEEVVEEVVEIKKYLFNKLQAMFLHSLILGKIG